MCVCLCQVLGLRSIQAWGAALAVVTGAGISNANYVAQVLTGLYLRLPKGLTGRSLEEARHCLHGTH